MCIGSICIGSFMIQDMNSQGTLDFIFKEVKLKSPKTLHLRNSTVNLVTTSINSYMEAAMQHGRVHQTHLISEVK